MHSILEELACDNISALPRSFDRSSRYEKPLAQLTDTENQFHDMLSHEA